MVRRYVRKPKKPWVPKYKPGTVVLAGLIKSASTTKRRYYHVMCRKCGNDRLVREQKLFITEFCKKCTGELTYAQQLAEKD